MSNRLHLLSQSKLIFDRFFLSNVTSDLGKTQQISRMVTNGVDNDVREKRGAILADAMTFRLVFSRPFRRRERCLRNAFLAVRISLQPREVLADDFAR